MSKEELYKGHNDLLAYLKTKFNTEWICIGLGNEKLFVILQNSYMNKWEVKSIEEAVAEWSKLNAQYEVVIRKIGKITLA